MFIRRNVLHLTLIACSFLLWSSPALGNDDEAPAWLQQAARSRPQVTDAATRAAVLHREQAVTLDSSGRIVTVERHAVRILTREGRGEAAAVAFYLSKFSQIKDLEAWLMGPGGALVRSYGKKDTIDRISDPDDIYDEGRIKVIDASGDADVGFVFGYTSTTEDQPLFYQDRFSFQDDLPTAYSKFSLALPNGWTANGVTFNRGDVPPQVNGSMYVWELRDLPAIPDEPLSPSFINLAPMLAVNYSPPAGQQGATRSFADWTEVSRWTTQLYDPQVVIDDPLAIKARELTQNAKTELEKIRAIGTFVQNLQYISIDIGVGYGNGLKPRPSNTVLSRGYGDCKDKANLMRAMLRVLKIESYPIAIYSGDPNFVKKDWPSPSQFNHCILAVRVSPETAAKTILEHPTLGKLLIFDATDQFTPVGDLPDHLQGSHALIIAGENGGISKMPITPPDFDLLERDIAVTLNELGEIKGTIREKAVGQTSAQFRREFRSLSAGDFRKAIEGWLTRGATGAQLVNLQAKDKHAEAGFDLDVEFSASRYGQLMQNRLLVFKPVIVGRRNSISLTEPKRTHPIELGSNSMRETVTYTLPPGFAVDEVPAAVNLETEFGKYSTSVEQKDGKLLVTRQLIMNRKTIGADKYASVRDFFTKMHEAEQSPVVLIRK